MSLDSAPAVPIRHTGGDLVPRAGSADGYRCCGRTERVLIVQNRIEPHQELARDRNQRFAMPFPLRQAQVRRPQGAGVANHMLAGFDENPPQIATALASDPAPVAGAATLIEARRQAGITPPLLPRRAALDGS